jgi:two-component system cell cycle response regulator
MNTAMNKSNLLIVDDSPYVHKMVRAYLEPDPLILHSAFDGESALDQAAQLKPSLILMDIDMPDMDGLEACRRLKSSPTALNIPIIFLTADTSLNDKIKALDMGAVDYITKPFKPEELRARVRSALRTQKRLEQIAMVDAPSGLWNKAFLDLQMPPFMSLARRARQPLACIVGELDDLQALIQTHGQDFQDNVIKSVANVFLGETRTEDVVCHCGGGRYVALVPSTDRAGAANLADRIRREIERQAFCSDVGAVELTCSFGVADMLATDNLSVLDAADTALVRSKETGGNVVTLAPGNPGSKDYPA